MLNILNFLQLIQPNIWKWLSWTYRVSTCVSLLFKCYFFVFMQICCLEQGNSSAPKLVITHFFCCSYIYPKMSKVNKLQ